jgi:hypothetical protein
VKRILATALLLLAACQHDPTASPGPALAAAPAAPLFAIRETRTALEVTCDGKPFTTYRFAESEDDPAWQMPYFYPVILPSGDKQIEITSDQTRQMAKDPKADHPHHRSIWIGWGDVNGANHWTKSPEKQRHIKFTKLAADSFVQELTWDSKGSTTPVLTETRAVKFLAYPDGSRGLDITTTFTAPTVDAVFKCKPLNVTGVESGLVSIRIAKAIADLPENRKTITSGADAEEINAGEAAARSTPSAWCDYTGLIDGNPFGVALVNAPANPGGLVPFHVRLFGFLADIANVNFTIKKGDSLTFRHLVILHPGTAADARIQSRAKEWRTSQ